MIWNRGDEGMHDSEWGSGCFSTFIAVLIAMVTVVGAIIAWRVTVASNNAGGADTLGILAAIEREDVTTRATTTVMGHLTAYSAFIRDNSLAKAFDALAVANPQRTDFSNFARAFRSAANYSQDFIPPRYFDRNKELDRQRDLGAHIAEYSINKDVEPQPHFAAADKSRQKARWLLVNLILLGGALVLLTMANASEHPLRHLFWLGGVSLFGVGTLASLLVELISLLVR